MTINEIKKEALRLMFTTYGDPLDHVYTRNNNQDESPYNVDEETNEQYTQYLVNMDGCISRCLKRFESVGALDMKVISINLPYSFTDANNVTHTIKDGYFRYELPNDCAKVSKVAYEDKEYVAQRNFRIEGREIVLLAQARGKYIVSYYQRVAILTSYVSSFDLETQLGINDGLACLIPYFIAAELYQEDEPSIAAGYRNTFEAMLADYLAMNINDVQQVSVSNIW